MSDNPESVIPKLSIMGIQATIDTSSGQPVIMTESSDFETIIAIASLEGWDLNLQDRFGESASFNMLSMKSFNEIASEISGETASDDFLEDDDSEDEAEEDDSKEASRANRFVDKDKAKSGSDLEILTDSKSHKMAANLYAMIGNESMARYPSFLSDFDGLLVKYKSGESNASKDSIEDDEDFEEAMSELAAAVEIAKKEKSPRQLFLSEIMKAISGDEGEKLIRQWREGRFEKFTGAMIKIAKTLVEHSPAYKEIASDVINEVKPDVEEIEKVTENSNV